MPLVAAAVVMLTASLAMGADLEEKIGRWESLEEDRVALVEELGTMERAHQNFVEAIENLTSRSGARRERLLTENLRVVEELERIQRQMGELTMAQEGVRGEILEAIEERRQELEADLRVASNRARFDYVVRLNDLQRERSRFSSSLPGRDQQRVEEVLATARQLEGGHPRAMLAVADELEDAEEALLRRLAGLDRQIAELERSRGMQRRSRSFGEVQNFFDEDQRNRQIGSSALASTTRGSDQEGPASGGSQEQESFEEADEAMDAAPESGADFDFEESEPEVGGDDGFDDPGEDMSFGADPAWEEEEPSEEERVELRDRLGADQGGEGRALTGRVLERDLERLRRERREIREEAEKLRREAEKLRREAREGL